MNAVYLSLTLSASPRNGVGDAAGDCRRCWHDMRRSLRTPPSSRGLILRPAFGQPRRRRSVVAVECRAVESMPLQVDRSIRAFRPVPSRGRVVGADYRRVQTGRVSDAGQGSSSPRSRKQVANLGFRLWRGSRRFAFMPFHRRFKQYVPGGRNDVAHRCRRRASSAFPAASAAPRCRTDFPDAAHRGRASRSGRATPDATITPPPRSRFLRLSMT